MSSWPILAAASEIGAYSAPMHDDANGSSDLSYEAVKVVQSKVFPTRVVEISPETGHYFFDFGKDSFSSLRFIVDKPVTGHIVVIHLAERSIAGDRVDRKPPGTIRYQKAQVTLKAGQTEYAVIPVYHEENEQHKAPIKVQKGLGEVMPFRYVEIENAPEGFAAAAASEHSIWQMMSHVALEGRDGDGAGEFESSDQSLDAVWNLCKYTIKAGSAFGIYIDGDRERKPYEADAYIASLGVYCVGPQYELGRVTHEYMLTHPTWPIEWKQHSVLMGYAHYMYSGDSSSIKKYYDVLKSKVMLESRLPNGLFVAMDVFKEFGIMDWPKQFRDDYDMTVQVTPVVSAFHYRTLVLMARIAQAVDKPQSEQDMWETLAKQTYKSFNELLWDEVKGCYFDGINDKGVRSQHVSAHANFFPLALGLVPLDRVDRVVTYLKSRNMDTKGLACGVYGAQYLLEALYAAGEGDFALKLLTCKAERSWLNMIHAGCTMTSETWNVTPGSGWTWSHIWGTAPANVIPRMLLGVQPMAPGFSHFSVQPQPGSLKSVKGTMPTPHGLVEVDVTANTVQSFKMTLVVPVGTVARVGVPTLGNDTNNQVLVNGVSTKGLVVRKTVWVDSVTQGTHTIERRYTAVCSSSAELSSSHTSHAPVKHAQDDADSGIVWGLVKSVIAWLQWLVTWWWAHMFSSGRGDRDVSDTAAAEYTLIEVETDLAQRDSPFNPAAF